MVEANNITNDRLESMITDLLKCKIGYTSLLEECKNLREGNVKLELELKDAREMEKSHRYHLQASRDMIGNLQETISQLVYLKRDIKRLKDDIISKDMTLSTMQKLVFENTIYKDLTGVKAVPREYWDTGYLMQLCQNKDKDNYQQKNGEIIEEMQKEHEKHIEELISINDKKLLQVQYDSDTQIAQFTCVIEELREKIKEVENEHKDKMNIVVLEYEEKIQRYAAEVAQLQEQLSLQSARTDANIDAYRKKLEDLEDKLKQNQFKEYLAQSHYPSQSHYENKVERPYSSNSAYNDAFHDYSSITSPKTSQHFSSTIPTKHSKPTLQVTYLDTKNSKTDKKGQFNITKKRKLYSEKDFLDQ